jgi:serine/threonine protein kinase
MANVAVATAANPLDIILTSGLVSATDIQDLPFDVQETLRACADLRAAARLLLQHKLLTEYQAGRVESGCLHGLVLGNYRVLDRLNSSGTTAVYQGEHAATHAPVVIKVLSHFEYQNENVQQRFLNEMRVVAEMRHPNIVAALDNGQIASRGLASLRYFVMECVPGKNLEEHVKERGPLPIPEACGIGHQVASALAEGHRHQLVHRELTPAKIRLTPQGTAKVFDFGVARKLESKLTEHGAVLGDPSYMAPEQSLDSVAVDIRSDIFGLGGTLFWCLTAQPPFPRKRTIAEDIVSRRFEVAPSVRSLRPEIPGELAAIITRMMARRPEDRFATPEAVMEALDPFCK